MNARVGLATYVFIMDICLLGFSSKSEYLRHCACELLVTVAAAIRQQRIAANQRSDINHDALRNTAGVDNTDSQRFVTDALEVPQVNFLLVNISFNT